MITLNDVVPHKSRCQMFIQICIIYFYFSNLLINFTTTSIHNYNSSLKLMVTVYNTTDSWSKYLCNYISILDCIYTHMYVCLSVFLCVCMCAYVCVCCSIHLLPWLGICLFVIITNFFSRSFLYLCKASQMITLCSDVVHIVCIYIYKYISITTDFKTPLTLGQ